MTSIKYLLTRYRSSATSASVILAITALCSGFLGLVRDRLLAGRFGTGSFIDAYQISFLLPDLMYNLFIIGALSAAFIPIFIQLYQKNKKEAWKTTNQLFNLLGLFIIIVILLCYFFTPQLVNLLGKLSSNAGTSYDPQNLELIVTLTRILLVSPLLLGISALFTGILQSLKHFLAPALSPITYNLGIIFGILFLVPTFNIFGIALGVIIGACLHLLIQIPSLFHTGFRYSLSLKITKHIKAVIKLAVPRTLGLVAGQASFWINKVIAFTLGVGAVSTYYFANNLQYFSVCLLGSSIAIATFPDLARANNNKRGSKFIHTFTNAFRQILFLTIPVSVLFLLLRAQIVRLVLGTGEFDWPATIATAQTLGFFAISIFAQSAVLLISRAFYALHDTKTPVIINVFSLLINISLALLFKERLGVAGLALAFSLANFFNVIFLLIVLRLRVDHLDDSRLINSVLKIVLASCLMGVIVYVALHGIAPLVNMRRYWGVFVQALGAGLIGILFYIGITWVLKCEEFVFIRQKIRFFSFKMLKK